MAGKKSDTSWLTMVKRVFRSPTKDGEKKSGRRREEPEQEEEEKKREKRRWLFRKHSNIVQLQQQQQHWEEKAANTRTSIATPLSSMLGADQMHAMEVAEASAEEAAAEIVRLTRPSTFVREQRAAVLIQTAFRGYLARRALRALRGLVKLQALVRGQNVRKQAELTLKCMQALVRVQDRIQDRRARLSHSHEGSRKSMFFAMNFDLWESKYLQDIHESRDVSSTSEDWDDGPRAMEEVEAIVQGRKEAALKRERALAYDAFSGQKWRSRRNSSAGGDDEELEDRTRWLDRWMAIKQWDYSSRASTSDRRDTNINTVEVDSTSRPYTSFRLSNHATTPRRRSMPLCCPLKHQHNRPQSTRSPSTPSPCKPKPLQVRSASPRCLGREENCFSAAHTPTFESRTNHMAGSRHGMRAIPNYMAATESAKAKARSQSTPRQRPSTERDRGNGEGSSARKRLSYHPVPPDDARSSFSPKLRSPSLKSVRNGYLGMELRSNYPSCYTVSTVEGGEISPSSTTKLRWLK